MFISKKLTKVDPRIGEIIISRRQIRKGIKRAVNWINNEYIDKDPPLLIGILKGCIPFFGQIMTQLKFDYEVDFMSASSFKGGTERTKSLDVSLDLKIDVKDRHVLIIEDIIDTARTLNLVIKMLQERKPKSIKIVTLLDKPECRIEDIKADFSSFVIPNKFIVGYGLDYKEIMRNFDYIGCLSKEYLDKESGKK